MYDKFNKDANKLKQPAHLKIKSFNENSINKQNNYTTRGRRHSINTTNGDLNNINSTYHKTASNSKPTSNANNLVPLPVHSNTNPVFKTKPLDSQRVNSKEIKTPAFLYQHEYETENRRMTLEMIKMMLKADPSYNNNPKSIIQELNFDKNILGLPDKIVDLKESNNKDEKKEEIKDVAEVIPDEKLKFLYHLVTPKIVTIKYKKVKTLVLIKIVPSNICYTAGVEFYDLKMDSVEKNKINISIELLKIDRCYIINEMSFSITLIKDEYFYKKKNKLKVYSRDKDENIMYALALNYFSQLVKCKVYNKFYNKKI